MTSLQTRTHLALFHAYGREDVVWVCNAAKSWDISVICSSNKTQSTTKSGLKQTINMHPALLSLDRPVPLDVIHIILQPTLQRFMQQLSECSFRRTGVGSAPQSVR